jgi:hypothetical protein
MMDSQEFLAKQEDTAKWADHSPPSLPPDLAVVDHPFRRAAFQSHTANRLRPLERDAMNLRCCLFTKALEEESKVYEAQRFFRGTAWLGMGLFTYWVEGAFSDLPGRSVLGSSA